jgi:drug/metabolite transporter (DMT)-like permease
MAHLVLVLTLVVWSFSFLAAARVRQDLDVPQALLARFLPVLLAAGLILLARRPRVPRRAWPVVVAMGLLGGPIYHVFFFIGLKSVPTGTAALIVTLSPVLTALLARVVLREPFDLRRAAGLALSMAGLFVVIRHGTDRPVDWPYLSSALLLALSPLCWALYTVLGKLLPPGTDSFDATLAGLVVGCVPLLAFVDASLLPALRASPGALGAALYLGIICTVGGYAAWTWALGRLPAGEVAAFVFLNPPLANLWAWLIEGTRLRPLFVAGAAVLLAGVALNVLPLQRTRPGADLALRA